MNKRLMLSFASVTLIVVLLLMGVNWYYDPHLYFGVNAAQYKDFSVSEFDKNERMPAVYKLENNPQDTYEGIIIGGSKARPLSETLFSECTGKNHVSCVADCGTFDTYEKLIKFAIEHQNIKHVVIHLSGRETFEDVQDDIDNRMPAQLENRWKLTDTFYYLFTDIKDTVLNNKMPSTNKRFSVQKPKSHDPADDSNKAVSEYLGIMEDSGSWIGKARIETTGVRGMKKYYRAVSDGDAEKKQNGQKKRYLDSMKAMIIL